MSKNAPYATQTIMYLVTTRQQYIQYHNNNNSRKLKRKIISQMHVGLGYSKALFHHPSHNKEKYVYEIKK
jgi:hypothetical protein